MRSLEIVPLAVALLLTSVANAFVTRAPMDRRRTCTRLRATINNNDPFSDMEAMIIMNVADFCLKGDECSVEDKDALIQTIKEKHMDDSLLQRLYHSRDSTPASQEHVDELIKSIMDTIEVRVCIVSAVLVLDESLIASCRSPTFDRIRALQEVPPLSSPGIFE